VIFSSYSLFLKFLKSQLGSSFSLKGRMGRAGYLFSMLTGTIFSSPLLFAYYSNIDLNDKTWGGAYALFCLSLFLILVFYLLAFTVKRLHDLNLSSWWFLIVAAVSILLVSYPLGDDGGFFDYTTNFLTHVPFLFIKGTKGKNKYGDPPEF